MSNLYAHKNFIAPVKLTLTKERLQALNELSEKEVYYRNGDVKPMYSILLQSFEKIRKKWIAKTIQPGKQKKFNISLKPYEAFYLEIHIQNHIATTEISDRARLRIIADQINQNLA